MDTPPIPVATLAYRNPSTQPKLPWSVVAILSPFVSVFGVPTVPFAVDLAYRRDWLPMNAYSPLWLVTCGWIFACMLAMGWSLCGCYRTRKGSGQRGRPAAVVGFGFAAGYLIVLIHFVTSWPYYKDTF